MNRLPVTALKGIGPSRAEVLKSEAGIETIEDLLYYIPRRYLDRSNIKPVIDCFANEEVTVIGRIISVRITGNRKLFLQVDISDGTDTLSAVFFGAVSYLHKLFSKDDTVLLSGKISISRGKQIVHPDFDFIDEASDIGPINTGRIIPLYRSGNTLKKSGFDSRGFRRVIMKALDEYSTLIKETLPESILKRYNLTSMESAISGIHFPDTLEHAASSRIRLAFNEIYFFQYYILLLKNVNRRQLVTGRDRKDSSGIISSFIGSLPFDLTDDQRRVIGEIRSDIDSPYPMNRLLQGDVGSGKTIVALVSSLVAVSRGEQCAFMVPTEILAQQHYETARRILPPDIIISLITGSNNRKEREYLHSEISSGKTQLIIGTHSLIQSDLQFHNLGLIIIDEQHRFGVEQRGKLRIKGNTPDLLVMTATPIPRSLSMTLYGDLDASYIRKKPANRLPVKTLSFPESRLKGVYNSLRNYIEQGRQVFYVLPLIEESEKIDLKSAMETYQHLGSEIFPDIEIALLHGKLPQNEKDNIMTRFKNNEIKIVVSTTVIEVGIDIPNANVIVIEHAERFGLAQLHQLRGRVGRGEHQSFCILIHPENISSDSSERIRIMTETDDGFEISENDLKLRGSGQLIGTRQHGFSDFEFLDITTDIDIIVNARTEAELALSTIENFEEELDNIRNNRLSRQLSGLRHKRILALLA